MPVSNSIACTEDNRVAHRLGHDARGQPSNVFRGGHRDSRLPITKCAYGAVLNIDYAQGRLNVFDPVYTGSPVTSTAVQNALLEQRLYGLYTQLQSRIDNWVFLLGGRYDRVNSSYRNKAGTLNAPADLDYWDGQFTWQAGLMYQFDNGVSPYLSYSTAYNPTQQVSSTSGPLDPTTSEQYEAGVKYEPKGWNTTVSASIYDLRKKDDSLYDSVVGDYRNIGRSRAKGVELEVSSDLTDNFGVHLYGFPNHQGCPRFATGRSSDHRRTAKPGVHLGNLPFPRRRVERVTHRWWCPSLR